MTNDKKQGTGGIPPEVAGNIFPVPRWIVVETSARHLTAQQYAMVAQLGFATVYGGVLIERNRAADIVGWGPFVKWCNALKDDGITHLWIHADGPVFPGYPVDDEVGQWRGSRERLAGDIEEDNRLAGECQEKIRYLLAVESVNWVLVATWQEQFFEIESRIKRAQLGLDLLDRIEAREKKEAK